MKQKSIMWKKGQQLTKKNFDLQVEAYDDFEELCTYTEV